MIYVICVHMCKILLRMDHTDVKKTNTAKYNCSLTNRIGTRTYFPAKLNNIQLL